MFNAKAFARAASQRTRKLFAGIIFARIALKAIRSYITLGLPKIFLVTISQFYTVAILFNAIIGGVFRILEFKYSIRKPLLTFFGEQAIIKIVRYPLYSDSERRVNMPFIPYCGNILDKETDIIVAPCVGDSSYIFPITAKIYEAADYCEIKRQLVMTDDRPPEQCIDYDFLDYTFDRDYKKRQEDLHPKIDVTKGLGLKQKNVIHLYIDGEYANFNEPECRDYIANCYYDILTAALRACATSIIFPLLESCVLGLPMKEAWENATNAVNNWLEVKRKKLGHPVDMNIYIVSDTAENGEKFDSFSDYSCFPKYEEKFQKKLSKAKNKKELMGSLVMNYISRMKDTRLADIINWDSGSINRIKNDTAKNKNKNKKKLRSAHKHRIVAMAVGLKLDDYERYEFIRCLVKEYPSDLQDFCVEKILRSGITEFNKVNELLYGISPKLVLDAPVKNASSNSKENKDLEK